MHRNRLGVVTIEVFIATLKHTFLLATYRLVFVRNFQSFRKKITNRDENDARRCQQADFDAKVRNSRGVS